MLKIKINKIEFYSMLRVCYEWYLHFTLRKEWNKNNEKYAANNLYLLLLPPPSPYTVY